MVFKKLVVVDGRGHLLGRMASTVAKELLSGQKVVRLPTPFFLGCLTRVCMRAIPFLVRPWSFVCCSWIFSCSFFSRQVICRAEEVNISGSFFRNKRAFVFFIV